MKSVVNQGQRKVRAVRQQCATYQNLIRVRVQLQKCSVNTSRWPHPWLSKAVSSIELAPEEATYEDTTAIQRNVGNIFLRLYGRLASLKKLNLADGDPFESIDILPRRRDEILERLDHWNQKTNVKVDKSFEVLNKSISSQVHYFLENNVDFLKKARPSKIPDNVIGYGLLQDKLGLQDCRKIILSELYNDQLFYVQLLRFLIQTGAESDANLREEEQQLRNDHSDKPRMSVAKTSKSRRLRYTVVEKLQNFVVSASFVLTKSEQERTRNKAITSPDVVDLIIRSLFKS
ncbi:hypothetical protein, conserved [Babesia bigemina]|uniref:Uncharacterized protein n=1 Tax=Babesia bigemina TaxID=5866 RepID=A0A061DE64_BABBI|nr:hypothetical protein, conserved [Babesia bigemina]CDR98014.1 hypothetical protein, conserved [Babesia bigemina]|eukprot:XP_012770200.1 hypothetical protein, conserved [Babesia bigemina]